MATVPSYGNLQTSVGGLPNAQFQGPSGPTPGAIAADEASTFGRAAMGAGSEIGKIALSIQDQVNQVRVNDAMNQARIAAQNLTYDQSTGFLNRKGANVFYGPDGKPLDTPLTQEYGDKLRQNLDDLAVGLGNDVQRRAFQMQSSDLATQFHGQLENHTLQQFNTYHDSVDDSTVKLASDGARLHWDNPEFINGYVDPQTGQRVPGALDQVKGAVMSKMQRAGLTGAPADAALLAGVSSVHAGVVLAALENNNPQYALGYLTQAREKGEMSADDVLKLQGHVNQNVWATQSNQAVQVATAKSMPQIAPSNFDRLLQVRTQIESGGKDFKPDGTPITSTAGALYKNQVMPSTAANPGFGIKPADTSGTPQQVAAEYNRVGDQLLQALVQKYGDPTKAMAAYNAGSGAVDKAVMLANARPGGDYLTFLPRETQDYVAKANKLLSGAAPVAPRPTELDFVNTALSQLPPGAAPQVVKMTREAAVTQFGVINKSLDEQGNNALAAAQRWINSNVGTPVDQMPADLRDAVNQFKPGQMGELDKLSKQLQRGDVVTNNGRYNDIVTNMDQYAKMSNPNWDMLQTELSQSDFRALSKQRATYLNGGNDASAEGLNRAQVNRSLNQGLASLGIPTTPPKGDEAAATRLGGIRSFVDQSIFDAQKAQGKKLTPEEINDHIHKLFATDVNFKNTLWYGGTSESSTKLMTMQLGDLPDGAADGIKQALIAKGNKAPTDTDILNLYRRMHVPK